MKKNKEILWEWFRSGQGQRYVKTGAVAIDTPARLIIISLEIIQE